MTTENPTKPNGDPKTRQKHPKQEQDHPQNWKKFPQNHRSTAKVPLNLPDVFQNPQFTLSQHDDQHEPNENPMETPKHVKNTPNKNRIKPQNERKPQKP